jgi:hypothetical protein
VAEAFNEAESRLFVRDHDWVFAKTMRWMPHWYLVKDKAKSYEAFDRFEATITERGADKAFGKRVYRYLELDGWVYWAMDISDAGGRIINRARPKKEIR